MSAQLSSFLSSINHKPVAVFGLARSGLSVVKAVRQAGGDVIAWDDCEAVRERAEEYGASVEPLTLENLKDCGCLVLAPGVPLHHPAPHPVVQAAREIDLEIIGDIELYYRAVHPDVIIGITGTNGKSTTTALITHVLKSNGVEVIAGGNIGVPVLDLPSPGLNSAVVLELSSFQLDLCVSFRSDISVLLNITPDHLDRHGTMAEYAASKARIFDDSKTAIITGDDPWCIQIKEKLNKRSDIEVINISDFPSMPHDITTLRGTHNIQNMQAAFAVCFSLGVSKQEIMEAFRTYPGLDHRQYPVAEIGEVSYINDSKATNPESAEKSLSSFENIYWIVGGQPTEGGLEGLEQAIGQVCKAYIIGEAAENFSGWCQKNGVSYSISNTLECAVKAAHQDAQAAGEKATVLLAPACKSFDQFSSFEERGNVFAVLVRQLEENK